MTCPNNTQWVLYAAGEVPPGRRQAMDAHLAACDACRRKAADLQKGLAALGALAAPALRPEAVAALRSRLSQAPRQPAVVLFFRQRRWAVAAAAVFVLALGAWAIVPSLMQAPGSPAASWVTDAHLQEELVEIAAGVEMLEAACAKPTAPAATEPETSGDWSMEEIDRFIDLLQAEMDA
jgi:anti-sigma factor RsiW